MSRPGRRRGRGSEQWLEFIERTAGSITDPLFERPEQGEFEERDPLW